jgi:hypothetical protein
MRNLYPERAVQSHLAIGEFASGHRTNLFAIDLHDAFKRSHRLLVEVPSNISFRLHRKSVEDLFRITVKTIFGTAASRFPEEILHIGHAYELTQELAAAFA